MIKIEIADEPIRFLLCNSRQKALGYAFFSLGNMQNVVPPATKSS
jgi:hypothetical protein